MRWPASPQGLCSQPAVFSYTVCSSLVALLCAVDFSIYSTLLPWRGASGYKLVIACALGIYVTYCTQPSSFSAIYHIDPSCLYYNEYIFRHNIISTQKIILTTNPVPTSTYRRSGNFRVKKLSYNKFRRNDPLPR